VAASVEGDRSAHTPPNYAITLSHKFQNSFPWTTRHIQSDPERSTRFPKVLLQAGA
jgi:hypothetical protein